MLLVLQLALLAGLLTSSRTWDTFLILKLAALNLCAVLGFYALWGFSTHTVASVARGLRASVVGTALGGLPLLLLLSTMPGGIPWAACVADAVVVAALLPLVLHGAQVVLTKRLRVVRCLVIGRKDEHERLLEQVVGASQRNVQIVGYMNPDPARLRRDMGDPRSFDVILVADPVLARRVEPVLAEAPARGVSIEYLPDVVERTLRKIPVRVMTAFADRYNGAFVRPRSELAFRLLDIAVAMVLLVVLSPIVLLAAALVLLGSGGPVFFRQERHGLNGRLFRMLKFRTMAAGEPPGLTLPGKLLRSTHLNEIPQLLNVIAGHMSLVGPRPDIPNTFASCGQAIPNYRLRTTVRPGLTGIAQIHYRHIDALDVDAFSERLAYDAYYVKNRSVALYLEVLLLTTRDLLFRREG